MEGVGKETKICCSDTSRVCVIYRNHTRDEGLADGAEWWSKARKGKEMYGSFANGETAYDYDFDDGLGSGSFHKKKGRAGSGNVRKVTKKRVK